MYLFYQEENEILSGSSDCSITKWRVHGLEIESDFDVSGQYIYIVQTLNKNQMCFVP